MSNTSTIEPNGFGAEHLIPAERVSDLLCCAFEGGSNYWYGEADISKYPDGFESVEELQGARKKAGLEYYHWVQIIPCMEGGEITFGDLETENAVYTLNREAIERGLQLMLANHPKHYADWLAENDDAITGDVFLQLCVLGDVIYG